MTVADRAWYTSPAAQKVIAGVRSGERTWGEGAEELGVSTDALKAAAQRYAPTGQPRQTFDHASGVKAVVRRNERRRKELDPLEDLERILKNRLADQADVACERFQFILQHGRQDTQLRAIRLLFEYVLGKPGKPLKPTQNGESWEDMIRRLRGTSNPAAPPHAADANDAAKVTYRLGPEPGEPWEAFIRRAREPHEPAADPGPQQPE